MKSELYQLLLSNNSPTNMKRAHLIIVPIKQLIYEKQNFMEFL